MTINVNVLTVCTKMQTLWITPSELEGNDKVVSLILETLTWLMKETRSTYPTKSSDKAKLAHFSQLFVLWKAVSRRMVGMPWYSDNYEYERSFPAYFRAFHPELFIVMYRHQVFLGCKFSPAELEWIKLTERSMLLKEQVKQVTASLFSEDIL